MFLEASDAVRYGRYLHDMQSDTHTLSPGLRPGNLAAAQEALLKVYPELGPLVTAAPAPDCAATPHEPFQHLVQAVIHQQISMAAGRTVMDRLLTLVVGMLTPEVILDTAPEILRSIGLSRQKQGYLHSLAQHFHDQPELYASLPSLSNEDIIKHLTTIKGIGVWSAEMYLIFQLWRADVWPVQDLGVQHGVQLFLGLPKNEKPNKATMLSFGERCAGNRTLLAWYMWRLTQFPALAPEAEPSA